MTYIIDWCELILSPKLERRKKRYLSRECWDDER